MSRMIPTGGSLLLGGMLSYLGLPCNDSGSADDDNIKNACSSQSALIEAIDQVLPSTVQLVVMICKQMIFYLELFTDNSM